VINDTIVRYYWHGRWKYYDTSGAVEKYCYFDHGQLLYTKHVREAANPALAARLRAIDSVFQERHGKIIAHINAAIYDVEKAEQLRRKLFVADSVLFQNVGESLVDGYPTRIQVQDAVAIPFYILS